MRNDRNKKFGTVQCKLHRHGRLFLNIGSLNLQKEFTERNLLPSPTCNLLYRATTLGNQQFFSSSLQQRTVIWHTFFPPAFLLFFHDLIKEHQPTSSWFKLQPRERWVRNNLPSWWPFLFHHDFRPTRRSRCIFYNGNSEATAAHNLGSTGTGMKFSFCHFLGFFFVPSHVPHRFPFFPIFLLFITTLFHDLKEQFSKNSPAFPSRK